MRILRADSYMQVQRMRMNFEDKPDVVYRGLLAIVTGNVNYLFEKSLDKFILCDIMIHRVLYHLFWRVSA